MNLNELARQYDFSNQVIAVTGGAGILCGEIACALVGCNANVAIIDRVPSHADRFLPRLNPSRGGCIVIEGDVLQKDSMELASQTSIQAITRNELAVTTSPAPILRSGVTTTRRLASG